jgi:hypothetical protein
LNIFSQSINPNSSTERDHISIAGLSFLNFDYFEKRLRDLPGFEGFSPRWTLLTRLRNVSNPLLNTSSLFLIIVIVYII